MGWASGSQLLEEVAEKVMKHIPPNQRSAVASDLIDAFEGADCDTICEVGQEDIRREYDRRYPNYEE